MSTDFKLDAMPNTWVHPETGVAILDEDMPDELRPDIVPYAEEALGVSVLPWQTAVITAATQYAETRRRLAGDPEYQALTEAADAEADATPRVHLARNRLALHVELHTPML